MVLKNWVLIAVELMWLIDGNFQEPGGKIREAIHVFLFSVFDLKPNRDQMTNCVTRSVNFVSCKQICVIKLQPG